MTAREYEEDPYQLIGPYAVDAVTDAERDAVERYLAQHPDAAAEVRSLQEAAATLPTTAVEPPAQLRDAVMREARRTRPLPPVEDVGRTVPSDRAVSATALRTGPPRPPRRRRALLAAAAAAVVIGVGGTTLVQRQAEPMPGAVAEVMHAPDARESLIDMGEHKITVTRSMGMDKAVVTSTTMGRAPDGMVYQMWVKTRSGQLISGGVLPAPRDGLIAMPLHGDASDATEVAVSMEPGAGSVRPTTQMLGAVTL